MNIANMDLVRAGVRGYQAVLIDNTLSLSRLKANEEDEYGNQLHDGSTWNESLTEDVCAWPSMSAERSGS